MSGDAVVLVDVEVTTKLSPNAVLENVAVSAVTVPLTSTPVGKVDNL